MVPKIGSRRPKLWPSPYAALVIGKFSRHYHPFRKPNASLALLSIMNLLCEPSQNPPESGFPCSSQSSASDLSTIKGRGAQIHPSSRFERRSPDLQLADLEPEDDHLQTRSSVRTEYCNEVELPLSTG
jgi:hypothetical protein